MDVLFLALFLALSQLTWSQLTSFSALSPPTSYPDGVFTVPNTAASQLYGNGTLMTVSWNTTYQQVNLFLIINNNFGQPVTLLTGASQRSFPWIVNDYGNNTHVFSFRIVNALGSVQDQNGGGFYTGNFWISDPALASTKEPAITVAPAITASSSISGQTTMPSASSTVTSASNQQITSLSSSISSAPTTQSTASSSSAATTGPATQSSNSGSSTAISAGIGVGVGVGVVALGAGALFWIFRRKRQQAKPAEGHQHGPMSYDNHLDSRSMNSHAAYMDYRYGSPTPPKQPIEAPHFSEPRELQADIPSEFDGSAKAAHSNR